MAKEIATHLKIHTKNAQLLLRPSEEINRIIGGTISHCQKEHGIKIYACTALSNHIHLVFKKSRKNPHGFQSDLKTKIDSKARSLLKRADSIWGELYSEQAIFDNMTLLERSLHTMCNPVHHALVYSPALWPGVNGLGSITRAKSDCFLYTDLPEFSRNAEEKPLLDLGAFTEINSLSITRQPIFSKLSKKLYRETMVKLIDERSRAIAVRHTEIKKSFLGFEKTLKQSPFDYPKGFEKSVKAFDYRDLVAALPQQFSHDASILTLR